MGIPTRGPETVRHKVNPEEKKVLGVTTASHGLVHLYEGVLPPLIPLLITAFDTDYFHLGLVVTIFSYAFGLGSLPAGLLADRLGPRRLVTSYLFGSGLAAVFIFSADSFFAYAVLMGVLGLFCSSYHPASNTLISHTVREKGQAFGLHGIAGSIGVALAPVLSAWMGAAAGWKTPHVVFGILGIGVAFYSLSLRKIGSPVAAPHSPATRKNSDPARPGGLPYLKLTIFFFSAMAMGLSYKGIMTFLPTYMGKNVHISFMGLDAVAIGGAVATLALLSGALGQYISGRLVDRYQPEKIYLFAVLTGTLFVLLMAVSTNLILVLSSMLYALVYFSTQPTQNFLLSKYTPRDKQGLIYGLHFFITFGIGSTSAAVSGYVADILGLRAIFYAMAGCFALATLFCLYLVRRSG